MNMFYEIAKMEHRATKYVESNNRVEIYEYDILNDYSLVLTGRDIGSDTSTVDGLYEIKKRYHHNKIFTQNEFDEWIEWKLIK